MDESLRRKTKEASELGWAPGVFPKEVTLEGAVYQEKFVRKNDVGDILYVIYYDLAGRSVIVFND